jgi:hypothetical protein
MKYRLYTLLNEDGTPIIDSCLCFKCFMNKNNVEFVNLNYGSSDADWMQFDGAINPELSCTSCGYPITEREGEEAD